MRSEEWAAGVVKRLDLEGCVQETGRFVDVDVTSSFAHWNPNVTVDEVLGYRNVQALRRQCDDEVRMCLFDYDGIIPEKERPAAWKWETTLKEPNKYGRAVGSADPRLFFEGGVPMRFQTFYKERLVESLRVDWKRLIKSAGLRREDRQVFERRFLSLVETLKSCAVRSSSTSEFLCGLRRAYFGMFGVGECGVPESSMFGLFAQKLEEDLEAGFPFWRVEVPERFAAKHRSNESTFLFYGVSKERRLVPVRFFESPERFEFVRGGEVCRVLAEDAPGAMVRGELMPTVTLLNYVVLSPARKPRDGGRRVRVHVGGRFMAGPQGYAWGFVECLKRKPGFDRVELVWSGYDGRAFVQDGNVARVGLGAVVPHFGVEGIARSLEGGEPAFLYKNRVLGDGM